jgi:hypothetical protein
MAGPAYFSGGMNIAKNWDWVFAFILQDTAEVPVDLTGSVLKMMIRKRESDHQVYVSVTSEDNTIEITDAVSGAFTIIIRRDQLAHLIPGD